MAWSFLSKNVVDLSSAPVIRKSKKSAMPSFKDYKTLITFPVKDNFSCMDDVISFLSIAAEELNVTYRIACFSCIKCLDLTCFNRV